MSFLGHLFGRRRAKATPAQVTRALMRAAAQGTTTGDPSLHSRLTRLQVEADHGPFEYLTGLLTFALLPIDLLAWEFGAHASPIRRGLREECESLAREALGEAAEQADWALWRDRLDARLLEYAQAMQLAGRASRAYSAVGRVASRSTLGRVDPEAVGVLATHFAHCLKHFGDVIASIEVRAESRASDREVSDARNPSPSMKSRASA